MQVYSSEETQQSREVLEETLAAIPGAILIGGWGSWVRTGGQMSHDIDLIVTRPELACEGTPINIIRDQFGHSSLAVTDRYLRDVAP